MSTTLILSFASLTGAAMFFFAGVLFARMRQPRVEPAPAHALQYPPPLAEREALRKENLSLRKAADNADALRSENRQLRNIAATVISLRSENVALKTSAKAVHELRSENDRLQATAAHVDKLQRELQPLRHKASEVDTLRDENRVLRERLATMSPARSLSPQVASLIIEHGSPAAVGTKLDLRRVEQ
jgi:cell shape-determining protein MreC